MRVSRMGMAGLLCIIAMAVSAQAGGDSFAWDSAAAGLSMDQAARRLVSQNRALLSSRGVARTTERFEVTQAGLRRALQPGEALLLYEVQPSVVVIHALVADREPNVIRSQMQPGELRAAAREWRRVLAPADKLAARAPVLRSASRTVTQAIPEDRPSGPTPAALSTWLMPPALQAWLQEARVRHLSIAGSADMAVLPWAALPLEGKQLVDFYSTSIVPDLAEFVRTSESDAPVRRMSEFPFALEGGLVIANPKYPTSGRWNYPNLPGAEAEGLAVSKLWGGEARSGAVATKDALLQSVRGARLPLDLLYLATHAVASEERPLDESFLVLAGETDDAATRWTAREIQTERLEFNLAVLSACQTGLGQAHDAGVIGVARAFYLAGVPQTVMSLWSVDDRATLALMTRFAQELTSEKPFRYFPAEAMQRAMIATRRAYPDPAHWASFSVFGIPNVIRQ